jgi:hypothetical protein
MNEKQSFMLDRWARMNALKYAVSRGRACSHVHSDSVVFQAELNGVARWDVGFW